MDKVRVAIIGCGAISSVHADGVFNNPAAELLYAVDSDRVKAQQLAQKYQCQVATDYHELLDCPDIDLAIICTPHYLHQEMSMAFLQHGKHVLCEKPIATTVEAGLAILEVANSVQREYAVCFQNRFNATSLKLKSLLEQDGARFGGLKGVKLTLNWHRTRDYYVNSDWRGDKATEGGGVLMNQAIHTIDLVTWLVGMPESIKGKVMTNLLDDCIDVEDTASALGLYKEMQPFVIEATNTFSSDLPPEIYFEFEHGQIKLVGDELLQVNQEVIVIGKTQEKTLGKSYWGSSHQRLLAVFLDKILQRSTQQTQYLPKSDALDSLQIIEGIYQSSQKNQRVVIKNKP